MKRSKYIMVGIVAILIIQISSISWSYLVPSTEVVYVNNDRLINGYQGMIDARATFEEKHQVWKANIDTLTLKVTQAIHEFEKNSAQMSKTEQQLSKELIQTRQQQLQQYQQAIQQQAEQADTEMTNRVLTQVNTFLSEYGDSHDYQVIMGANNSGNILYAQEGLDITDRVLEELNRNYSGR